MVVQIRRPYGRIKKNGLPRGISKVGKRYRAVLNGTIHVGMFDTVEVAVVAWKKRFREEYGFDVKGYG
jgi:hypothetical protein